VGGRFRPVNVLIYTTNGVFAGTTLCQPQQRLLDALNKGFVSPNLQSLTEFLPLSNVVVITGTGDSQNMETAYIRKSNILFIGEQNTPTPSSPPSNVYPVRRKKCLEAVIHLPEFSLVGNIHSEMWEELQEALNRSDQFIPLTDVDFKPALPDGITNLPFVAVNKDHIVYVGR
jgi:hypothetical protein